MVVTRFLMVVAGAGAVPNTKLRVGGGEYWRTCVMRYDQPPNSLDLHRNVLGEGGGRALAETLRINTTLASLNFGWNRLGEGGERALADTDTDTDTHRHRHTHTHTHTQACYPS